MFLSSRLAELRAPAGSNPATGNIGWAQHGALGLAFLRWHRAIAVNFDTIGLRKERVPVAFTPLARLMTNPLRIVSAFVKRLWVRILEVPDTAWSGPESSHACIPKPSTRTVDASQDQKADPDSEV